MKIIITILAQLIIYAQGIISVPLLIATLGIEKYGQYILDLAIVGFATGIATIGILIKARNDFTNKDKKNKLKIYKYQLIINSAVGIFVLGVIKLTTMLMNIETTIIKIDNSFIIFSLYIIFYIFYSYTVDYYRYSGRTNAFTILTLTQTIATVITLAIVAKYKVIGEIEVLHVFSINGAIFFVIALAGYVSIVFAKENNGKNQKNYVEYNINIKENINVSKAIIYTFILESMIIIIERIIITKNLGSSGLGFYSPIFMVATLSIISAKIMNILFYHEFAKLNNEANKEKFIKILNEVITIGASLSIAYGLFLLMNGKILIKIITSGNIKQYDLKLIPMISLGAVFAYLSQISQMALVATNKTKNLPKINLTISGLYILGLAVGLEYNANIIIIAMSYMLWQIGLSIYYYIELKKIKLIRNTREKVRKIINVLITSAAINVLFYIINVFESENIFVAVLNGFALFLTVVLYTKTEINSLIKLKN